MFSVIFEVLPGEGKKDEYLELAKHLKPILETIDGFVGDGAVLFLAQFARRAEGRFAQLDRARADVVRPVLGGQEVGAALGGQQRGVRLAHLRPVCPVPHDALRGGQRGDQ